MCDLCSTTSSLSLFYNLSSHRVSGELPSLQLKLSAEKYEKIMNLVDKITGGPNTGAPVPPPALTAPTDVYSSVALVITPPSYIQIYASFSFFCLYKSYCDVPILMFTSSQCPQK